MKSALIRTVHEKRTSELEARNCRVNISESKITFACSGAFYHLVYKWNGFFLARAHFKPTMNRFPIIIFGELYWQFHEMGMRVNNP